MDGHPQLITPWNSSEFHAMAQALRSHHNSMNDQARQVAAELRKDLPKATGAKFQAVRLDLKANAIRVTWHIAHAAALNQAAARSYTKAYMTFLDLFANQNAGNHGKTFNVDK